MITLSDVDNDSLGLIQIKDRNIEKLAQIEFSSPLLKKALQERIEEFYQPLIQALNLEYAIRESIEQDEQQCLAFHCPKCQQILCVVANSNREGIKPCECGAKVRYCITDDGVFEFPPYLLTDV
jgi:hypothetical protein